MSGFTGYHKVLSVLRLMMWLLFIFALPLAALIGKITKSEDILLSTFIGIGVMVMILSAVTSFAKCPNCKKHLYMKRKSILFWTYSFNPWKCMNCGLKISGNSK